MVPIEERALGDISNGVLNNATASGYQKGLNGKLAEEIGTEPTMTL